MKTYICKTSGKTYSKRRKGNVCWGCKGKCGLPYDGPIPTLHAREGYSPFAICGYEFPVQEHHDDPPVFPTHFMDDANTHIRPKCSVCFATIDINP